MVLILFFPEEKKIEDSNYGIQINNQRKSINEK